MNVQTHAARTARIFDLLAMVVIGAGTVVALLMVGAVVFAVAANAGTLFVVAGVVGLLVTVAATALGWAGVTLATIIAGHIAGQSS